MLGVPGYSHIVPRNLPTRGILSCTPLVDPRVGVCEPLLMGKVKLHLGYHSRSESLQVYSDRNTTVLPPLNVWVQGLPVGRRTRFE